MSVFSNKYLRSVTRNSLLFIGDTTLLVLALVMYIELFYSTRITPQQSLTEQPLWYILIVVIWIVYAYLFDLYSPGHARNMTVTIRRTYTVALLTGITYLFVPFFSPVFPQSRLPAFFLITLMVVFLLGWRVVYAYVFAEPVLKRRAIIVGAGWSGQEIVKTLMHNTDIYFRNAYNVVAFVDENQGKHQTEIEGVKVVANPQLLAAYVKRLKIDEVIVAIPDERAVKGVLYEQLMECRNLGVEVSSGNNIYESVTGRVLVKKVNGEYFLSYPYQSGHTNKFYLMANRLINIVIGFMGVLAMVAFVPFVWLSNLVLSRGPLLYSQERVGKHGKIFTIYKFRSMVVNAEAGTGAVWAKKNDSRITLIGKLLRKTRIDELPQFWNVFKGDMNLIGPRPERPEIVADLKELIPFFSMRHQVKPGITGWAQVSYKYGASVEDALVKLQYDLYYIRYRSLMLDLRIIFRTIAVVLKFKGN